MLQRLSCIAWPSLQIGHLQQPRVHTFASACIAQRSAIEQRLGSNNGLKPKAVRNRLNSHRELGALKSQEVFGVEIQDSANLDVEKQAESKLVYCFWDLDNKKVDSSEDAPQLVAMIRAALRPFGTVESVRAFGNKHCFDWVPEKERELRVSKKATRKQVLQEPLRCEICGGRFQTQEKLAKHFKNLHLKEMSKRQKNRRHNKAYFRDKDKLTKYYNTRDAIFNPKRGFNLKGHLTKEDVHVNVVGNRPQEADEALKQAAAVLAGGIKGPEAERYALCIISDDRDFLATFRKFKLMGCTTISVSDGPERFGDNADHWLSWSLLKLGLYSDDEDDDNSSDKGD